MITLWKFLSSIALDITLCTYNILSYQQLVSLGADPRKPGLMVLRTPKCYEHIVKQCNLQLFMTLQAGITEKMLGTLRKQDI